KDGLFREDLYYRLAVTTVRVPALRERPEDIPALIERFARAKNCELTLSPATIAAFQCDPWPGNVRELRNAVERALALGEVSEAEPAQSVAPSFKEARDKLLEDFE